MKYSQVNWSRWDDRPEEDTYNDWLQVRKEKRSKMTQTAINRMANKINQLYQMGISADESVGIAVERCWVGIEVQWVLQHIEREKPVQLHSEPNVIAIQDRSTRDISIQESLADRSWADEL